MSKRKSVMNHKFSEVPNVKIQRSTFDRSHGYKTTFDAGYLVPILVDEALPGDTFNVKMTGFARLATPIKPIMDNMFMDTFFFAVPNRLLWENWEKFCGSQDNPGDSTDYAVPKILFGGAGAPNTPSVAPQSLADYMGLPINSESDYGRGAYAASQLPFRAYNLIWNEWFRDQNLQDSLTEQTGDDVDFPATEFDEKYFLQRRGKRHDYFTSALPWPQKGEAVLIPSAHYTGQPTLDHPNGIPTPTNVTGALTGEQDSFTTQLTSAGANTDAVTVKDQRISGSLTLYNSATINDLRDAFQIQKMLERDARGGTRYTEVIKSHFGVTSPDARLQRPEYLGGGTSYVNISAIAQTQATTQGVDTPQANLSALGTTSFSGHGFTKSFTEHCVIIGLVNVRADLTYQQGLNRMWSRSTRYDFFWPTLAHLGEQAIDNQEIYVGNDPEQLTGTFGYQERYAEYRYKPSLITGKFRSEDLQSLDVWHLSQEFESQPALNAEFIEDNPPIDRVIAVPSEPHFLFDSHFSMKCSRPMPLYGIPGLTDHF